MYALNFYSPLVADQLRSGRKSATIRLGDKSGKYKKGMVVSVLCGVRFSPREHVFDAVIDKVEVKTLGELSPREIEHDNPEIRRTDEMANFLGQLYNREVGLDDLVTVIRFSQIMNGPVVPGFRENEIFYALSGSRAASPTSPGRPAPTSGRARRPRPAYRCPARRRPRVAAPSRRARRGSSRPRCAAPSVTITHGPSPAPTKECVVPGGQWK